MRIPAYNNLKAAYKTLRRNRGRSFLTMLGIIIGVASVITIAGIGEGIKRQVSNQISHVGNDLITVRGGQAATAKGSLGLLSGVRVGGTLPAKDIGVVQKTAGVATAVPLAAVGGTLKGDHGVYTEGTVIATEADFPRVVNQNIAFGVFFDKDDEDQRVAVLGEQAAEDMFDEQVPLGRTFTFRGQQFMVRGILNSFASAPLSSEADFNKAIFIPYTTSQKLTGNNMAVYEILARPSDESKLDETVNAIRANLLKQHGDAHDFTVLKQADNLAATSKVLDLVTQLIIGAAAVSLFVGGIGIMNIMLVSVTERMREVGIRKAVGATNRQILSEFMAEAVVLSVVGGILGIVAAGIANLLLHILTNLTPVIQWQVVLLSAGISMFIGIIFGSAPAFKAARKDPITALRNE